MAGSDDLGKRPGILRKVKMPISSGSWLTNAGKSIGLATMDVLQEVMPTSVEMATSAAETMSNLRQSLVDLKTQRSKISHMMDANVYVGDYKNIAKEAWKNLGQDLKSGNLYTRSSAGELGDNFGDDFDFGDDSSWDVGDDSDFDANFSSDDGTASVSTTHKSGKDVDVNNVHVSVDVGNNSKLARAMDTQTKVAVDNARVSLEYSKAYNQTMLANLSTFSNSATSLLSTINDNVATMVSLTETVSKASSLSAKYYDDSMAVFNSINEKLDKIVGSSGGIEGDASRYEGKYNNILDEVISGGGVLNINEYSKLVKKQFGRAVEGNFFLSQIANMASQTDMLRDMFTHPLNILTKGIIGKVVPSLMREAASSFDMMLKETSISILHGIQGWTGDANPFLDFMGQTFGIGNRLKTKVDKSNYNRGKVDWTGESHKTLNEVIPYYLRKIAASISGSEEMVFDYNTGKFNTLAAVREEYDRENSRLYTREFSSVMSEFKESVDKLVKFENKDDAENVDKQMEKFIKTIVTTNGRKINLKNNSFREDVAATLGVSPDDMAVQLIAGYLDSKAPSGKGYEVASMLNRNVLDARAAISKAKIDEETGVAPSNVRYVDDGTGKANEHLNLNRLTNVTEGIKYKASPFIEHDKWGKTPANYLRDIYKVLLSGITVFPSGGDISGRRRRRGGPSPVPGGDNRERYDKILSDMDSKYESGFERRRRAPRIASAREIERARESGKIMIGDNRVDSNISEMFSASIIQEERSIKEQEASNKNRNIADMLHLDPNSPAAKMYQNLMDLVSRPGAFGEKLFKTADQFLFRLIFGGNNTDGSNSLLRKGALAIQKTFTKVASWVGERIINPLHEVLFGDDGIFTQIKNSTFFQSLKESFGKFKESLLGEQGEDGYRSGGILSDFSNEMKDIGSEIKFHLIDTENPDSVLSNIKSGFKDATDSLLNLFGIDTEDINRRKKEGTYHPITDALNAAGDRIKFHTDNAIQMLFGKESDINDGSDASRRKRFALDVKDDIAEAGLGKIGAGATVGGLAAAFLGGHVGFFSSMFLPGGFIGGALLGAGLSIIKHSNALQELLFGNIDADGERQGGIINREMIEAFNDNKTGIILGSAAGMGSALGILPSFLLPGGPIGGALIGAGVSMALKSQSLQNLFFGDGDEDSLKSKIAGLFKNAEGVTDKGRIIDTGLGAGLGLITSALLPLTLPGGPIFGALIGAFAGFSFTSETVQNFLFGKDDGTGKRTGGIFNRIGTAITDKLVPAVQLAQVKIMGWVERAIKIPFEVGIRPILNLGMNAVKKVAEMAISFGKWMGGGIQRILFGDKTGKGGILSPIIQVSKFVANATRSIALHIISAPFKLLEAVAKKLDLAERIRNILSPVIDLVFKPLIHGFGSVVKWTLKKITKGLVSLVTFPFRAINWVTKKFFGLGKWMIKGLGGLISKSFFGDAFRGASSAVNKFKNSRTGNLLKNSSTRRLKWEKDDKGRWKITRDKNYRYNNSNDGRSVGFHSRQLKTESSDWELYQRAKLGEEKSLKKFRNKYGKTADELLNDESLNSLKGRDLRREVDKRLGHDPSIWDSKYGKPISEKEQAKVDAKRKATETNAWKLYQDAMGGDKRAQRSFRHKYGDKAEQLLNSGVDYRQDRDKFDSTLGMQKWWKVDGEEGESKDIETQNINAETVKVDKLEMDSDSLKDFAKGVADQLDKMDDADPSEEGGKKRRRKFSFFRKRGDVNSRVVRGTTDSDMEAGIPPEEDIPEDSGHRAFGGKIKETGKYWLSKGEKVVSNIRDKYEDFKAERAQKHQYESMFGDSNFTNDETGEAVDAINTSFTGKSRAEENAERATAVQKGTYNREKVMADKLAEAEREEKRSFRETILEKLEAVTGHVQDFRSSWEGSFGKKGLITLGLIGIASWLGSKISSFLSSNSGIMNSIMSVVNTIKDIYNNVKTWVTDSVTNLWDKIKQGFDDVGGMEGILNNINEALNRFIRLLPDDKDGNSPSQEVVVNENGTIELDENGKVKYQQDENENGRNIAQRAYDWIFPQQTRIDVDGSITGTPGAAYTEENTYDAASGARLSLLTRPKIVRKGLQKGTKFASEAVNNYLPFASNMAAKGLNKTIVGGTRMVTNITSGAAGEVYGAMRNQGIGRAKSLAHTAKQVLTKGGDDELVKKAIAYTGSHNRGLVSNVMDYTGDAVSTVASKASTGLKNLENKAIDKIVGAAGKTDLSKASTSVTEVAKNLGEDVDDIPEEVLEKFPNAKKLLNTLIENVKIAFAAIKDRFIKFLKKKKVKNMDKLNSKLDDGLKHFKLGKLLKLGKDKLLDILGGVAKALVKAVAGVATFLTGTIGMTVAGGLLGAANAENFFQMDFDSLETSTKLKLRAVAAVFQAFLNHPKCGWFDIGNSIIYMITGTNFAAELGMAAFYVIGTDEEEEAVNAARDEFNDEYDAFVEEEYAAYVALAQEEGQEYMDFETFKQSEVSTSVDDYNAERHKTVGAKVWGGVKKGASVVGGGLKAIGGGIKAVGGHVLDLITNPVETISNDVSAVASSIYNVGVANLNSMADAANVTSVKDIFSASYWTPLEGEGFGGALNNVRNYAIKLMNLPRNLIFGLLGDAKTALTNVIGSILGADITGNSAEARQQMMDSITGVTSVFSSDFWMPSTEDKSSIGGLAGMISFYSERFFGFFPALMKGIAISANNGFSDVISDFGLISKGFSEGVNMTGLTMATYWKSPSFKTNTMGGALGQVVFYLIRLLGAIPFMIFRAVSSVGSGVKTVLKALGIDISDWGSNDKDSVKMSKSSTTKSSTTTIPVTSTSSSTSGSNEEFMINLFGDGNGRGLAGNGDGDEPKMKNGFPYYSQKDPSIANKPYKISGYGGSDSSQNMANRGCGPTAMAMVATKLNGGYGENPYSPQNMAALAEAGNFSTEAGTTPDYFTNVGRKLGMNVNPASPSKENVANLLADGPVILQGHSNNSSSPFTSGGHYVVATGVDSNGDIIVNDPNSESKSRAYHPAILKESTLAMGFNKGKGNKKFRGETAKSLLKRLAGKGNETISSKQKKQEKAVVNCMMGLKEKNMYTQNQKPYDDVNPTYPVSRYDVGKPYESGTMGGGDCSSTVRWVYQTCLGIEVGWNTREQIVNDSASRTVDEANSTGYPNEANLRPGDLIYFACDSSKPGQVSHVEMYVGSSQLLGQSGPPGVLGPRLCPITSFKQHAYLKARRVISDNTNLTADGEKFASGSFNPENVAYNPTSLTDLSSAISSTTGLSNSTSSGTSSGFSFSNMLGNFAGMILSKVQSNVADKLGISSLSGALSNLFSSSSSGLDSITGGISSDVSTYDLDADNFNAITNDTDLNTRRDAVYAKLRSLGYSKESAAGLMGNIMSESGFRPTVVGDSGHAYGLAQWHDYANRAGRWLNMKTYADSIGSNYQNIVAQTEFMDKELDPSVPFSDSIAASAINQTFGGMDNFRASTDIGGVTRLVMVKYERPASYKSEPAIAKRIENSKALYETYRNYEPSVVDTAGSGDYIPEYSMQIGGNGGGLNLDDMEVINSFPEISNNDKRYRQLTPQQTGGFGHPSINNLSKYHDARAVKSGGFGNYDDSQVKELLGEMLGELRGTNSGINKFNDKDFGGNGETINYYDNKSSNVNVSGNGKVSSSPKKSDRRPQSFIDTSAYAVAKKMAAGKITM